jgi:serine/threonine protein kinase
MVNESRDRDPVEVLGEEFLARRRRGENPQIHQYISSHRQYAEQISALFPAMIAMEDLKHLKTNSGERPIRLHVDRLERLGDYKIVREIGHGGMGIVYEAEQRSLHRRVAVKVFPKQAFGDSHQLKRFQREAETAGKLHHTNIVPVFGVGQQDGMHYFVMQYIDGVALDEVIKGLRPESETSFGSDQWIRQVVQQQRPPRPAQPQSSRSGSSRQQVSEPGKLSGEPVIELGPQDLVESKHSSSSKPVSSSKQSRRFGRDHWRQIAAIGIQVAEALQYAHNAGVLHRDIKPSNLILDSELRVWVTDFGLAVTHEQERISRSGDVVGTLRYMSPEQLHGNCDPRSDVYGLGLTLYELTTLRPAFDSESRGSLLQQVSKCSPAPPRSICRELPNDLETIVLKAIARSPSDRYRSAQALAEDLRRFCEDRPIRARRTGPLERLARWSRRNPALAGMSLALGLGAALSLTAISWNWRQAIQEKRNALAEGARAENNLTLALGSMDRLLERFESEWMSHPTAPGVEAGETEPQFRFVASDHTAAVLEEAVEFYDRFAQQNAQSPRLVRETAKAYRRAGDILERLGRNDEAQQAFQRSAQLLMAQLDRDTRDPELAAETVSVLNRLAMLLNREFDSSEAKQMLEQARFLLNSDLARYNTSAACMFELAQTNSNLGLVMWRLRQGEASTHHHRYAIVLLQGLVEENPMEPKYRLALARAYMNYHAIAEACNEHLYASEIRQSAASILEQLVVDFPEVPDYRCELSETLILAAQTDQAIKSDRRDQIARAVRLAQQLNDDFPTIPRYQIALGQALSLQATLVRVRDLDAADAIHRRSTELLKRLSQRFPEVAAYRLFVAAALREHGLTLRELNRLSESIDVLEEASQHQSAFLEAQPDSAYGRKEMASLLGLLAETLRQVGQVDRAMLVSDHARSYWKQRPVAE